MHRFQPIVQVCSARTVLGLCAVLLLASGCTFSEDPVVDAAAKRSGCRSALATGFGGGVLPYLLGQAFCAGTRKDAAAETKEQRWQSLCREAKEGDRFARAAIARHYRGGWRPVNRDPVEAYKWFALAADAGLESSAQSRDTIGAELTPDQLTQAQSRVASWSPERETCPGATASGDPDPA